MTSIDHATLYYFPTLKVHVGAIPKTGCTSLLNFFAAAERAAVDGSTSSHHSAFTYQEPQFVHSQQFQQAFLTKPDDPRLEHSLFGILTVRDPVSRLLSCWLDKFLFGDPWVARLYYEEPWFPNDFDSLAKMGNSFTDFARNLATDDALLRADRHWTPQALLKPPIHFDLVIPTDFISTVPMWLSSNSERYSWLESAPFPHHNRSHINISKQVLTTAAKRLIGKIYADDLELFSNASSRFEPAVDGPAPPELSLKDLRLLITSTRTRRLYGTLNSFLAAREVLLNERQELLADREQLRRLQDSVT